MLAMGGLVALSDRRTADKLSIKLRVETLG
jgi:hypothetical protein